MLAGGASRQAGVISTEEDGLKGKLSMRKLKKYSNTTTPTINRRCACSGLGMKLGNTARACFVLYPYNFQFGSVGSRNKTPTEKPLLMTSSLLIKAKAILSKRRQ